MELKEFKNDLFKLKAINVNGKPRFDANAVAEALGYKNTRAAIERHCNVKGVAKHDSGNKSNNRLTKFINEGNMYRLIINSKLPAAEKFEEWVMDEVLPSIRKTGIYVSERAGTRLGMTGYILKQMGISSRKFGKKYYGNIDFMKGLVTLGDGERWLFEETIDFRRLEYKVFNDFRWMDIENIMRLLGGLDTKRARERIYAFIHLIDRTFSLEDIVSEKLFDELSSSIKMKAVDKIDTIIISINGVIDKRKEQKIVLELT